MLIWIFPFLKPLSADSIPREELIAPIPHTLDTIPGFGPVFSAGIISELGELSRFDGSVEAHVAKLAGFKRRLNLPEQVKYAVEHELLLPFIGTGYPRRIQRLAQETRIAIQIGLHV